ncbi:DUF7511 domain-containing protein [Natronomonas marina]|uniref:DUF7511 domain-containing protein n=1 Tax=Natronomonas marina TaxID=2961939 RepID=UPI0020C947DE|nr:hypothetical protein [Natronomonas marina]
MPDGSDTDRTVPWIDIPSTEGAPRGHPSIEVIPDADSGAVTFAWRPNEDEATTAWITADADLLVDASDMQ